MPAATTIQRLRNVFQAAGYHDAEIRKRLRVPPGFYFTAADSHLNLQRLQGDGPLADLIRIFLLGVSLVESRTAMALSPMTLEELEQAGILERRDGAVRATMRVEPWGPLLIASDRDDHVASEDVVTGVNPAAITLANLTVRQKARTALDLGTGCGIQALLAAGHSERVIGVDINPRAIRYAEIGAGLSGISNVEFRVGSWFEPVRGMAFDLVIANPPFVISPESGLVFRDSGLPADDVCRDIVEQVPQFLRKDGFGCVLCNWVQGAEPEWWARPSSWATGRGCDVLVLRYVVEEPLAYVVHWNQQLYACDRPAFRALVDRWLEFYRRSGIHSIASGAVLLRRSDAARTWIRGLEGEGGPTGPASEQLLRAFSAQDFLRTAPGDRLLLETAFRPVAGSVIDQRLIQSDGEYRVEPSRLQLLPGLSVLGSLEATAIHVLFRCDGEQALGRLISETAQDMRLDEPEFRHGCLRDFRRLLELGLILPPGGPG